MGRTALSMFRLAREVRRAGHQVRVLGYVAAVEPFARIVHRVGEKFVRAGTAGPYAVVGHSLGGLLARVALGGYPADFTPPKHLIMLGTPNQMLRQARRYGRMLPYRWINGQCGQLLMQREFFERLPPLRVPYTIIASTRGGFDRRAFGDEPNDGLVAVSETMLSASDRPITFPTRHTFMMNDRRVRARILHILAHAEG